MVTVIWGFYHTDVWSSANFNVRFGFNELFNAIKMGWNIIINGQDSLVIGQLCV